MSELRAGLSGERVLVTGHTGFKGSWLALLLGRLGAKVTGLALPPSTTPSHFVLADVGAKIAHREGDVRELACVRAALDACEPSVVFHLAAQPIVRASYDDPKGTFDVNVGGTVNVLEAVRHAPSVRACVVVTSDKCYENRETGEAYAEDAPLGGHDPYSASKAAAELVAASYRKSFFAREGRVGVATARAGNVIGGGDFSPDRIVPDAMRALAAGAAIPVRNPASVRPWQHVLEPLAAYVALAERLLAAPAEVAEAWNFGPAPGHAMRVDELARRLAAAWGGGRVAASPEARAPHEAALLRLDTTKARARLGLVDVLDDEARVAWTASWYRALHDRGGDASMADVSEAQIESFLAARAAAS